MFKPGDIEQIKAHGQDVETVDNQIKKFKSGFPFTKLVAPATAENGLHSYSNEEVAKLAAYFDEHRADYEILKFVPASGAASRMFKMLFEFREKFSGSPQDLVDYQADTSFNSAHYFFNNLEKFAFYNQLKQLLKQAGFDIVQLLAENNFGVILDFFLTDKGMEYASLPKGLLLFHHYQDEERTSVEEHLVEGAHYATDKNSVARIHLTVSPEHQAKFKEAINETGPKYEERFGVKFDISFSQQKPSTDTIAVDLKNDPFREPDNSLLFRPGGHGALIENLDDLKGEIIFIKNIDNVVPDRLKGETYLYKKVIGGLLFKLQEQAFEFLEMLEDGNLPGDNVKKIETFAKKELNIFIPPAYLGYDEMEKIDFLYNKMNRPIRICGMVKNEGEPGGGPYWVVNEQDERSLQIVESSQFDQDNPGQLEIVNNATHFNPVDLVCGVRNFKGENFDLHHFIDFNTGFISTKSKDGKDLKAQELPGLWNGAMADWITVFVETPVITFNPVKTINDLLRPQHQPG